ncbi:hypothetical protein [Bartonella queenslandensis]|uniref:hypothetical protein n=2 Tax=Bartonella TaxID=773 RepID=UPI001BA49F83|nr:hypothetical protein [Bartonella queenslandensis]
MEDTTILDNVAVILAITLAFYYYFKASKLAKEIELRDELIESQRTLMEGQLAENDKKIKELQELQGEVQERLQQNFKEQECLTSYENIYENLQASKVVCALVREFIELNPITDEQEDRSQELLQQLMRDEQTKIQAIKVVRAFEEWFIPQNTVTLAQCYYWPRAQNLLGNLLGRKPMTWEELAKKSPEEQQRYFLPGKTIEG